MNLSFIDSSFNSGKHILGLKNGYVMEMILSSKIAI